MILLIISIFVIGYVLITLEHPIRVNKTATALITGVACWTVYILGSHDTGLVSEALSHHLIDIAQILFFLLGAMTIVELIDIHDGFKIITDRITSRNPKKLLWIISCMTFILAALLDNLAAAIVMVSIARKLISDKEQRLFIAGMIIIASNAGGAWSPIGDVTTTMLWIGGQVTSLNLITQVFLPSLVCLLVPLVWLTFSIKINANLDETVPDNIIIEPPSTSIEKRDRIVIFTTGIAAIIMVPIFKSITHLPPYMAMMLALGVVWTVSEILHANKDDEDRRRYTAAYALSKVDVPSILFFLGILLAVGSLEATHVLRNLAIWLDHSIGNMDITVVLIGIASAVVDNVPIVAAAMGMYSLDTFPSDSKFWEFLAYCAGTGGSLLVIGSAAGIAVMGMEKITFGWYLRHISGLALLGYLAGVLAYLMVYALTH